MLTKKIILVVLLSLIAGTLIGFCAIKPHLFLLVPVALVVIQVIFSSVDLGLTYSRNMIVLGVALGLTVYLADRVAETAPRVAA